MPHPLYNRDYILLNAANSLYSLYATMFIFLPAFLYTLDIREGEIGLLMATGMLVSVSLKPVNGLLVDRGGRTAFLISGAMLAAASTVPWVFVQSPGAHLFAIRIFQGMAYSLFTTASYAYIAAAAPKTRRGEALGIFGLSFFVPTALGGWIGDWMIREAGFRIFFLAAVAVVFIAGFLPLGMSEPRRRADISISSLRVFLTRPYFIPNSAGFLFGMAHGSLFTFLPVFLLIREVSSIGVFVAVYALSVIATRTLGRTLVDRLPRERLSLLALLLMGGGICTIPFIDGHTGLVLVGVVSGTGHGLLFPALSALILDRAEEGRGGMAMAMFTAAFDMGYVAGASAFGFVAEHLGYRTMFFSAAAIMASGAIFFVTQDPAFRKGLAPPAPGP
jgi:MFS family permease